jgi:hypothetical protein
MFWGSWTAVPDAPCATSSCESGVQRVPPGHASAACRGAGEGLEGRPDDRDRRSVWPQPARTALLAWIRGRGGYQGVEQVLLCRIVSSGVLGVPLDGEEPPEAGFGQLDGLDHAVLR